MGVKLTSAELAERLRVTPETIRTWAREGRIPCQRASQRPILFDEDEVEEALKRPTRAQQQSTEKPLSIHEAGNLLFKAAKDERRARGIRVPRIK